MNRKRLLKETQFKVSPQKALHDEAIETNQILQNIKNKATLSARGALVILPKARRAVKEMQFKVNPSKALHDEAMETNQILEEINKSLDDLPEQVRAKAKGDKGDAGDDYVLTEDDKKEIASQVKVEVPSVDEILGKIKLPSIEEIAGKVVIPTIEKVVEKTKIIHEKPLHYETVKEVTNYIENKDTGEQIVDKINTQDKKIEHSKIEGWFTADDILKELLDKKGKHHKKLVKELKGKSLVVATGTPSVRGASAFIDLTDTFSSYAGLAGQGLRVNATETGIDTYNPTDTDEKVKYNASDPSAGYISDKFIAGTGISLSEGTGADENKLVITNTLDLSGYVPYTGATADLNLGDYNLLAEGAVSHDSHGFYFKNQSLANVASFGLGGGQNWTFYDGVKLDGGTASRVLLTDASKNISYSTLTSAELEAIPTTYAKLDGSNHPFTTVKTPILQPNADGTSAIKVTKADGTTAVMTFDTTNAHIAVGAVTSVNMLSRFSKSQTQLAAEYNLVSTDGTHTLNADNAFRFRGFNANISVNTAGFNQTNAVSSGGAAQGYYALVQLSSTPATGTTTGLSGFMASVRNNGASTLSNAKNSRTAK